MKDIDFDELDRAVSSVLGQDKPVKTEAPAEKAVVEKAPEKTEDKQVTESEPVAPAAAITINPRPKTTGSRPTGPSLATTRRGKFMDVMHQTVQTGAPSKKPVLEPTPKREMAKLEPSKDLEETSKEDTPKDTAKPVEMVSAVEQTTVEPTATVDESHALIGAEPAPVDTELLEAASSEDAEKSTEKEETVAETDEPEKKTPSHKLEDDLDTLSIDDVPAPDPSLSSSAPQESPFLADAKVEKRPLGGSPESNDSDDDLLAGYGMGTMGTPEKKDVQSAPVVPVPRELEDDIVKVEAAQSEQEQLTTSSPFSSHVAASSESHDDGRVDGHPLFDTSTYHEPIAAVHHGGMPGWVKWLIGLMLCLAVGAGVGYFLFTAGL